MRKTLLTIALAIVAVSVGSCGNSKANGDEKKSPEQATASEKTVQILYFHGDRRCPTCIKVGEISLNLYNTRYASNSVIVYKEVNIDKEENKALAEKYQITGSSLLIDVKGEVKNITIDAFKYAKSDSAQLEKIITDIVEAGLKK
jgi:hypothetical protein